MSTARRKFLSGQFLTRRIACGSNEETPLGPSPPWHTGKLKQSVCHPCDKACVSACEAQIIRLHPLSHRFAGIPYLSFEMGGCTFCGACVQACPMPLAVGSIRPKLGMASVNTTRCLAWNNIVCMSCRSACNFQAIEVDLRSRPWIDEAVCTGCGACIGVCPQDAITHHCYESITPTGNANA